MLAANYERNFIDSAALKVIVTDDIKGYLEQFDVLNLVQEQCDRSLAKANAHLMYNIFDKNHRSPYLDRINFRIGLEFTLKKAKPDKNIAR